MYQWLSGCAMDTANLQFFFCFSNFYNLFTTIFVLVGPTP